MKFFSFLLSSIPCMCTASFTPFTLDDGPLTVAIDLQTASYEVRDSTGEAVLHSNETFVTIDGKQYMHSDGGLKLSSSKIVNGTDTAGMYTGALFSWTIANTYHTTLQTQIKLYEPNKDITSQQYVVFRQIFSDTVKTGLDSSSNLTLATGFPSFTIAPSSGRGVLAFQGGMTGSGVQTGKWTPSPGQSKTGWCRVTTTSNQTHSSSDDFNAYLPTTEVNNNGRKYSELEQTYCDCTGHGSCSSWAFNAHDMTEMDCAAKCDDVDCKCFDFETDLDNNAKIGSGVKGTGPVVLFQECLKNSIVLSPHSNFMAASQEFNDDTGVLSYGAMGTISELPEGYSMETVLVLDSNGGINSAMDAWGDVLLAKSGKARYAYQRDPAVQTLGYSTDNGAYYYYQTEQNKTYEQTLLDVKAYAVQENIPYQYVLLDSWWYYKGNGGGVATWDARPDIFPSGLNDFYAKTGWTGQLHNRYWSTDTPYASYNGGLYNFIEDSRSKATCPNDQRFWNDLIANKSTNGGKMFMYEQDWLDVELNDVKWLQENATAGSIWLSQMNNGCENCDVTIQMCMSLVREILQSTEMPAVTNARASGDYHPGNNQWDIGETSILAHAIGIAPSKDNYWSTSIQNGTHYGNSTSEPRSLLQSAVLSFSNGPVAPSDKVGGSNTSLIMRACDTNGRLLAPDRPAVNIDACIVRDAGLSNGPACKLWKTHAFVSNQNYVYLLIPFLQSSMELNLEALGFENSTTVAARKLSDNYSQVSTITSSQTLKLEESSPDNPEVVVLSPYFEYGFALLGEADKWVSVSSQRFSEVKATSASLTATVSGGNGEIVNVDVLTPDSKVIHIKCKLNAAGRAALEATNDSGICS